MNWTHYILQVNIYLIVFYGFYKLLLDKETYFVLNRIYLVSAGLFSLAIPFLRFEWFTTQPAAQTVYAGVDQLNLFLVQVSSPQNTDQFTPGNLAAVLYLSGILLLSGKLLFQFFALRRILQKASSGAAFSFFRKKVVDHNLPEQHTIHKHEEIHIRQLHTLDVLFFELISIMNWFNPIVYLYKRAAKNIHEYLADEEAAKFQGDKKEYALLLLSSAFGIDTHTLTNSFFNKSLIKKRIFMLHKERSRKTAILKYGLFVPLFALALMLSSASIRNNEKILEVAEEIPLGTPVATVTGMVTQATTIQRQPAGDWKKFYAHLQRSIRYPAAAQEAKLTGYTQIKFTVKNGAPEGAAIGGPALGKGLDTEVMKAILSFDDYSSLPDGKYVLKTKFTLNGTDSKTALKNNNLVAAAGYTKLNEVVIMGYPGKPLAAADLSKVKTDNSGKVFDFISLDRQPSYPGGMDKFYQFIGKTVKYPKEAQEKNIQGKVFLSFIVETDGTLSDIKAERKIGHGLDEEAIRVVKNSAKWIPGIQKNMKVRVKYNLPISFALSDETNTVQVDLTEQLRGKVPGVSVDQKGDIVLSPTSPLYIIDGVRLKSSPAKKISPLSSLPQETIASIEILKDATAKALYGDEGKYGVILITTTNKSKPAENGKPAEKKVD